MTENKPTVKKSSKRKSELAWKDKSRNQKLAECSLSPYLTAASTVQVIQRLQHEEDDSSGESVLRGLIDDLDDTVRRKGNGVPTLICQAQTLDVLFGQMVKSAMTCKSIKETDMWLKMALRAQSQCRSTFEAISDIKNPRVANYGSGQVNVANGHQQVNNKHARREKSKNAKQTNKGG